MESKKGLVLITLFLGLAVLGALWFYHTTRLPEPISLEVKGLPTFGKGKLQIVSFEDLRCCNCKRFHEEIFPQIKAHYIDTGKASYTFVPVAFMNHSKPLANAALAVYENSPERFLPYVSALFQAQNEDVDTEELLNIAKKVGGIDLACLEEAIKTKQFYGELEKILVWARQIMGKDFGVPTLYVNGIHMPTGSFRAVEKQIERIL